jgi:hypothetical protein
MINGVHVYRLPAIRLPKMASALNFPWLTWTLWPANLRRLEAILLKHHIDVLHVHNHMFDLAFAGVMKRHLGLPVVLSVHTIIKHQFKLFNAVLYPADRWLLKRNQRLCSRHRLATLERMAGSTGGVMSAQPPCASYHPELYRVCVRRSGPRSACAGQTARATRR